MRYATAVKTNLCNLNVRPYRRVPSNLFFHFTYPLGPYNRNIYARTGNELHQELYSITEKENVVILPVLYSKGLFNEGTYFSF